MSHTYDTKTNSTRSNGNPKTFTHTCGAGTTLLVLTLVIDGSTARSGGAPTYNSVALTQADQARQAATSPETTVEMWYLLDPPTGSAYNISIPNSGTVYITAESSSFKAATGSKTKLGTASFATGTGTNPTGPTHTGLRYGDVQIAVVGYGDDAFSGGGQSGTSLYGTDDGTYGSAAQYTLYAGGDDFLKWTDTTSEDWAIVSAVFTEYADIPIGTTAASKAVSYAVLSVPEALHVSKVVAYAVLTPIENALSISKAVAYAVLGPYIEPGSGSGPMMWIF